MIFSANETSLPCIESVLFFNFAHIVGFVRIVRFLYVVTCICQNRYMKIPKYSSTFAKQNQAVWPRLQSLLNLLLWTKGGEWVNYSMPWDRCAFGNVFFLKSCVMRHVGGGVKYFINMIDPRWIKQYSLHDQQFFVVLLLLHFRENQISVSAIMLLTSSVRFTTRSILNIYNKKTSTWVTSNIKLARKV